jgi:uncharacterized membrane protein
MNDTLLLILSLTACLIGSIIRKYYSDKTGAGLRWIYIFNIATSLLTCLILLVWGGIRNVSMFTLLLGSLFGIVTVAQTVFQLKALEAGPMSYTTIICSFSTLITALSGAMFFGEELSAPHIIGIVLMAGSFLLAVDKKGNQKAASFRWLIYCIITFVCTGGIGIMQKLHQSSPVKEELNAFLVIAFAVSAIASLPLLFTSPKITVPQNKKSLWVLVGSLVLCGVTIALNNKWNLYLSGVMDSAVFFPIVSGGGLVLNTLAAVLLFREKPTLLQWLGIVLGIASVIFLCNPFG